MWRFPWLRGNGEAVVAEPAAPVETAADRHKKKKSAQAEKNWARTLGAPAHLFLKPYLKAAGLPVDVRKILGRPCSFWVKKQMGDIQYAEACAATIESVDSIGSALCLGLSRPDKNGANLTIYFHGKDAHISFGFESNEVVQFRLL